MATTELSLALLGPPVVRRDGTPVTFDTRKATALLALLASVLIAVFALALPAGASGRCYGLWLALAGTLAVLGVASASLRDERPFRGVPVSR